MKYNSDDKLIWRKKIMPYKVVVCMIAIIVISVIAILVATKMKNKGELKVNYDDLGYLTKDEDSYHFKNKQGNVDEKCIKLRYDLTGINTLCEIEVRKSTDITYQYKSKLNSGRAKLILVSGSNEVESICEGDDEGNKKFSLEKGTYRVRLVGDNANGEISTVMESDEDVKINVISNHIEFDW